MRSKRSPIMAGLVLGGVASTALRRRRVRLRRQYLRNQDIRVLVVGLSAFGAFAAAQMARIGIDVTLLDPRRELRRPAPDAIIVRSSPGAMRAPVRVQVAFAPPAETEYDLVIVAEMGSKAVVLDSGLADTIGDAPLVLVVDSPEALARPVDRHRTWPGLVASPGVAAAWQSGSVTYLPMLSVPTRIGEVDGSATQRLRHAASVFERAGLKVGVSRHIASEVEARAAHLAVWAACVRRNGSHQALRRQRGETQLFQQALLEAREILRGSGTQVTRVRHETAPSPHFVPRFALSLTGMLPGADAFVESYLEDREDVARHAFRRLLAMAQSARLPDPRPSLLATLGEQVFSEA